MTTNPSKMSKPPRVGILGGGQLAQMLAQAARPLGIDIRVLVKNKDEALPGLEGCLTVGSPDDPDTAAAFAKTADVITLENEFVATRALRAIEETGTPLLPRLSTLTLIQDKWHQKEALIRAGIPVTACQAVATPGEVESFASVQGWPVVLKRRHMGYDGKGNATIRKPGDLNEAWLKLSEDGGQLYAEAFCPFERELAVIVCTSWTGEVAVYPVVDSVQRDHICHRVEAPGDLPAATAEHAASLAVAAIKAVGGIGSMGVELFLKRDGGILVNELAPRVHNSGHYTIEGCECSQFENHLRAILGWPLGSTGLHHPCAVMINLLGADDGPGFPRGLEQALKIPGAHVHLYGKKKSGRARKMGHLTVTGYSREEVRSRAEKAAAAIVFGG